MCPYCRSTCQRAMSRCCLASMELPTATCMWPLLSSRQQGSPLHQWQGWCCSFALPAGLLPPLMLLPSSCMLPLPTQHRPVSPCWSRRPTGTCILVHMFRLKRCVLCEVASCVTRCSSSMLHSYHAWRSRALQTIGWSFGFDHMLTTCTAIVALSCFWLYIEAPADC